MRCSSRRPDRAGPPSVLGPCGTLAALLLLTASACDEKVRVRIKVGVADAGLQTSTSTTAP